MSAVLSQDGALAAINALRQYFAAHLAQACKKEEVDLAAELARIGALLDTVDFSQADAKHLNASHHPVVSQLKSLEALPLFPGKNAIDALLAAFLPYLEALPWRYSYEPRADVPSLEKRMAWAELVGPVAPFKSERVCLGLTAIGPDTLYPAHYHPAIETYLVLHGTARWTANAVTREHPPGTFILHRENIVHSMQTGSEALLAAYAWTGDVHTLSAYAD
jgi:quercetin dioxygenase-like cupin family protein